MTETPERLAAVLKAELGAIYPKIISRYASELDGLQAIRDALHELSPLKAQPVDNIRWVPIEQVTPNDYNPNSVAHKEMGLLYHSIRHDGYTQPVVTVWDPAQEKFVIVDGFHRYYTCLNNPDLMERNQGRLPIVVLDKDINDRMASTVRHNRARGKHSITGMSSMVFQMLDNGWEDHAICNELGMEPEELIRLKHITGFSKLFEDVDYRRSWVTKRQVHAMKQYEEGQVQPAAPADGEPDAAIKD